MPDLSNITPVTRLEEFIDRISRGGGGGGALPEVTEADEGKVLSVVDNDGTYEWGAAACSCAFNVKISEDPDNPGIGVYVLDKTYNEIYAAYTGGKYIQFVFPSSNGILFLPLIVLQASELGFVVLLGDLSQELSNSPMAFISATADGVLRFNPGT